MKRLGVIGCINRDTIVQADGSVTEGLGGSLYTVLALAHLGTGFVEVWPVCCVGEDVAPEVMELLGGNPHVRTDLLRVVSADNFHCQIHYEADGNKDECLHGHLPPLNAHDVAVMAGQVDGWLVNFITGYELALNALCVLRDQDSAPILMDVHSLTLRRAADGKRHLYCPHRWRDWLRLADIVQMNEREAAVIAGVTSSSSGSVVQQLLPFARGLLRIGPTAVVITLGSSGALAVWTESGYIRQKQWYAYEPERAVDTTGCGDVFLAGLGHGVFADMPFSRVVDRAVRAAGVSSRSTGLTSLAELASLDI